MGARETNVPEERSATVRRDREQLTSAAKKQRQKEAATDRHQAAAGEQPPLSVGEETRFVPLLATDPKCKLRKGNECCSAGGFPSNPILSGSAQNICLYSFYR